MKDIKITKENKRIESFEGKILHPSLDVREGALILGFRYRATPKDEKEVFLISKDGNLGIARGESVEIDDQLYYFEKRGRKLMRIEERWNLDGMQQFIEDYLIGKDVPRSAEAGEKITELIKKYIGLEKEIDHILISSWIIGTYFFPIFYAYPFLNIKAPKRSGKSQCLNLLRQLCFNAIKARPTLAALGDTVDSLRGTYLIDQADSLDRKGGEELLDILADSYKKDGGKRRTINFSKNKQREVVEFETYCPKVFASIKELPEDLRDRCLIIQLIRSQKNFPDPSDENENWHEIRGMIYKLLIDRYLIVTGQYAVCKCEYRQKENPNMVGRTLELWLPLEVIMNCIGFSDRIEEAKQRFLAWYGFAEYEPSDLEEAVVVAILNQFQSEESTLSPKAISELIDLGLFNSQADSKQRASKVGWIIKKFNLSSEKKTRTKEMRRKRREPGKLP